MNLKDMPYKPGSYEVTVCVFKKGKCQMDDSMVVHTSLAFDTGEDVMRWMEVAGVGFQ